MSRIPAALIYTFIAAIYVRRNVPRHPVACYVSRRMADLMAWLDRWGLKQLGPLLAAQDIDLDALKYLIEDDFKELGLTIGLRRRLLRAIEEDLRRPAAELAPSTPGGLAPSANQGAERRQLTILFSDLAASTELSLRLDPEEMSVLLRAYQACCVAAIQKYGGQISRFSGDGILTYFCYPQAHEDDAERAVRAALEIVCDVPRLRPHGDIVLSVRIGIATGQVLIGETIGEGESAQVDVVGETPNLAARLQAEAGPNGIVISAGTHRLTEGLFDCASLGKLHLKGFPEPVVAWQVHGTSMAESRFDAMHSRALTPMVGRDRELGLLMDCWERVGAGEAQVALLSGEAGVGKSRMLNALRAMLHPSGPYVLTLYCSPYHQASALHPVINHYERFAGIVHDDSDAQKLAKLETLLAQTGATLEETVPIAATLLSIPFGHRYAKLKLTPEQLKEQTLQLLIRRIGDISLQKPVLFLVEDAHWIDPTTLELVSRMIPALKTSRVFLIVTLRTPTDSFRLPQDTPTLHLPVARLDRQQAQQLLRDNLGDRSMSPKVSAEIIARADGNPLFVEELSKAVLESGLADVDGDDAALRGAPPASIVPATLHDSLMARLDRMSLVKPVAQFAAVLGRVFTLQLLSAAAPPHWIPIDSAITTLASAEIILPLQLGANPTYQFKHALLQDVAYQSLLKVTRRAYHARIAHVIAQKFGDLAETQPEIVARHFTEAELYDEAVAYWLKAGQRSTQRSSNLDAISHFERGLALVELTEDLVERPRIEYKFCVALVTPLIATKGYNAPELERLFERALRLSEEIGDTEEILPVLYSRQAYELVGGQFDRAAVHAEEAIRIAERNPLVDSAAFAGRLFATLKLFRGEATTAGEQLKQMLAQYDSVRHGASALTYGQDHYVACASYLTLGLWFLGFTDEARRLSERAIEYARSLNHTHTLQFALAYAGALFAANCRDVEYLESTTAELLEIGKELASPGWSAAVSGLHGKLLIERGRSSEGIAKLQAGITAFRKRGAPLWQPTFLTWLAEAHAAGGDIPQGLEALKTGQEIAAGGTHWMDAELHRGVGELLQIGVAADHAAAEASFMEALAVARSQSSRTLELRAAMSLARLWRSQQRDTDARALLQPALACFTEGHGTADLREAEALLKLLQ
jgi:class 3 adenylate cyclase/predicted ATPase